MATVDFETFERQALGLSVDERARLAHDLLESIGNLTAADAEPLWLDEAERRARAIDRGDAVLVDGESVSTKARALVR